MDEAARAALMTHADHEVTARLADIQAEVVRRVPNAIACIRYRMPAFRMRRAFFYFAAFKRHIGIYPPVREPEALVARLAPYRGPKGNLSFPHRDPLPIALIGEVAERLASQYGR